MKIIVRSMIVLFLLLIGIGTSDQIARKASAAGPTITSIGGWGSGGGVSNGRWTGQPSNAPSTASNKYKGYLAIDTWDGASYWDIYGSGFGSQGTQSVVWLDPGYLCPCQFSASSITSWSDTKIRVKVTGMWQWAYATNVKVMVRTSTGATTYRTENIVAAPRERGYGQCTWEVFFQRKGASLSPPSPNAYATTGAIGAGYVPQKWDVLFWGTSHTAIITSTPTKTVSGSKTTYSFTITERNAKWDEAQSTRTSQFIVQNGVIVQGILSNISSTRAATSYWR